MLIGTGDLGQSRSLWFTAC